MKPFTLLIKPSGSDCNIDCAYCFYKHRDPYAGTGRQRMSEEVLDNHTMCTFSKQCTGFVVIEHTGDAYCCEFFIEPQWRLGNILENPLAKLAQSKLKRTFARNKQSISNKCIICRHLDYCRGGCTKDRTRTGEDQSHFCQSYKQLFDHTLPRFNQIAAKIQNGTMDRKVRPAEKIRLIVK